jgi:hypothetical protein
MLVAEVTVTLFLYKGSGPDMYFQEPVASLSRPGGTKAGQ